MSAFSHANLVVLLWASVLLCAGVARTSTADPDARWTVVTAGLAGLACALLVALHASPGW